MSVSSRLVGDIMTKDVRSVSPEAPASEALAELFLEHISCLTVCEGEELMGIVTERDMVAFAVLQRDDVSLEVSDVMTAPVVTVRPSDTLDVALRTIHDHGFRHLPVINESGALVGIVTQTDLLRAAARP